MSEGTNAAFVRVVGRVVVQWRDELRVQLHLGRLEARDEFERLEGVWRNLKHQVERAADDAEAGLQDFLTNLREGYESLRNPDS